MRELFYGNTRTMNRIKFAKVTEEGVVIDEPIKLIF
jgi:hypothetical protein